MDHKISQDHWGSLYRGHDSRGPSQAERTRRTCIETSAMQKAKAQQIVDGLDSSAPFTSRFEFVEALAALAAVFFEDMDRKVTGANQKISHLLWCSADPDRAEWLFNNLRWRHTLRHLSAHNTRIFFSHVVDLRT